MDGSYQRGQSETSQPLPVYNGGYQQTRYTEQQGPTQSDFSAPSWTPQPAYDGQPYGIRYDFPPPPEGEAFGGPGFPLPYGFDSSLPPPPLPPCPPPGHFPGMAPPSPVNRYGTAGVPTFQPFAHPLGAAPPRYDRESQPDCGLKQREDLRQAGVPTYGGFPCYAQDREGSRTHPEDEEALQKSRDRQWLAEFLQSRGNPTRSPETRQQRSHLISVPALRETLYGAAQLLSQLEEVCHSLRHNVHNDAVWADSSLRASHVQKELQDKLQQLSDAPKLDELKTKASRMAQKKSQRQRARKELQVEKERSEERRSEKEAAIDKWRMRRIQEVEEKKKEQELKQAADSVLCEVRKKQADVKKMQDVLRSLDKLRRLRKEAASRKGIVTELQCDEAFSSKLEQLKCVVKRRTALYSAEEKALMVMLEGEQEEERKREQERRVKKERDRQLERKRCVDAMLFGDELPAACLLQPFTEYYSQAQHSLQPLIQIRREWDTFLVVADHPDGSSVPESWILPPPPSDQVWASALQAAADPD